MATPKKDAQKKTAPKKAAPQQKKAAPKKKQVPPRSYAMPPVDPIGSIHDNIEPYDARPMIDNTLDSMIASFRERLGDIQDLMEQARGAKVISRDSCILAALPGVMRRSSLEDPKVIVDQAVNIGTALYERLEQK